MSSIWMILSAIALLSSSGLPACLLSPRSATGQRLAAAMMFVGSLVGFGGLAAAFNLATPPTLSVPWFLPWGQFTVAVDAISLLFLAPIFVVPALGSIYGLGYWKQSEHPENGRRLVFFYGLLAGSMALVVVARDAVLFLIAWEIMALAAYFAATAEDDNPEVCRAGWVYLIATHAGTSCLLAMFALWRHAAHSFALVPIEHIPTAWAGTIFVLALVGFGFKAGIMPLHVWLPGAHANAPSHVSAVMSGVMLKMGVYGIVRITALLPVAADWWGGTTLTVGAITGVAGIAFAIGQKDIKRILAYSSIENIGIIMMGIGLALLGRSHKQPSWIVLGLGGALLHVWNHGLFKSLLFFNAGAVIHAAHTRDIEHMGGLAKRMPRTTTLFVLGAVAICALPPLNGFASEWLIYSGLFQTLGLGGGKAFPVATVAAVPLAMIGALAVACFARTLGTVFLGNCRGVSGTHAQDPSASMLLPMTLVALGCIGLGLFPGIALGALDHAARAWGFLPGQALPVSTAAPVEWITATGLILIVLAGLIVLVLKRIRQTRVVDSAGTWDCGYLRPTSRIQYTGSSLGQMLVGLLRFMLWPKTVRPSLRDLFPHGAHFKSLVPDAILDRIVLPLFSFVGKHLPRLRYFQQGQTQVYVLYILAIVIVLLLCGFFGV